MQVLLPHASKFAALCRIWNISRELLGESLIKINAGLRLSLTISATQLYLYRICWKYLYFLYLSTTILQKMCRMLLCGLSLLPAGITDGGLKLIACLCCSLTHDVVTLTLWETVTVSLVTCLHHVHTWLSSTHQQTTQSPACLFTYMRLSGRDFVPSWLLAVTV
jgi:hypothetical protein